MSNTIKAILYATDLNESSLNAFRFALSLAKQYQAKLLFLHVVEPLNATAIAAVNVYFSSGALEGFYKKSMDEVYSNINTKMETLYRTNLDGVIPSENFQFYILEGMPASLIVKSAEEMDADMIAMESRSHSGVDKFIMGSVANKVASCSNKPVLLMPAEGN